ncbi:hypothetical protein ACT3CE_10840 [Marinifilum sp. RC60d5]|uniref:hypothetical protein n=1 Tax=Marinifilum sp. RC60d5 TaxID=3458414 RepID=UPI00403532E4
MVRNLFTVVCLFVRNQIAKAKETDPENHGLLPEEMGDAIRESMENGATGICLFTPDRMTDEHWVEFEKAILKKHVIK